MFAEARGNGACGTNCGSMHMLEDNSESSMIKMKSKVNKHIADDMDHYLNVRGLPYIETVFGKPNKQICDTKEELIEFFRSDRALNVYSNFQEMQAMANIFNMPIEVFSFGTRTGMDGKDCQFAEWMEPILPEAKAAHMAEHLPGYYSTMHLYHSRENHFDLLVPDSSRIVTLGMLGSSPTAQEKTTDIPVTQIQPKNQNNRFQCEICGFTRNYQSQIMKHMKIHDMNEEDCSFNCKVCSYQSKNRDQLTEHIKMTNKTEPTCRTCNKSCSSKEELDNHIFENHRSYKPCKNFPTNEYEYDDEFRYRHIILKQD